MRKEHEKIVDKAFRGLSELQTPLSCEAKREKPCQNDTSSFRDGLMKSIMEDNPGLTYEELDQQMAEFGF